jgi:hypothetical protein
VSGVKLFVRIGISIQILSFRLLQLCLILHLNKSRANLSNCRSPSCLSTQVIFWSIKPIYLLVGRIKVGRGMRDSMCAGAARIISSVNTCLLFKEVLLFSELIFFFPSLVVLDSLDLNVS